VPILFKYKIAYNTYNNISVHGNALTDRSNLSILETLRAASILIRRLFTYIMMLLQVQREMFFSTLYHNIADFVNLTGKTNRLQLILIETELKNENNKIMLFVTGLLAAGLKKRTI
jgi:hypothetical protein